MSKNVRGKVFERPCPRTEVKRKLLLRMEVKRELLLRMEVKRTNVLLVITRKGRVYPYPEETGRREVCPSPPLGENLIRCGAGDACSDDPVTYGIELIGRGFL